MVTLELSDPVECSKRTKCLIYYIKKNLVSRRPAAKTLIKYNSNNLEENDEKEKESYNIEFTDQNTDPEIMKMLLTLDGQV